MATITAANVQALTDSIARHITDLAALLGSPSAIQAGQATTLSKVAALNDISQESFLVDGFIQFQLQENALISNLQSYNAILDAAAPAVLALHNATGGLTIFCRANSIQVAPAYADAHNRAAGKGLVQALGPDVVFGSAQANLGQITLTGAGAGTFADGTAEPATYGNAPLSIVNAGAGATGAAAGTYTVTYSAYNAAGALQTGLTASATMPASSAAGAAVSLAVSGVDVTGISVTGGTAGDKVGVKATALRTPAY